MSELQQETANIPCAYIGNSALGACQGVHASKHLHGHMGCFEKLGPTSGFSTPSKELIWRKTVAPSCQHQLAYHSFNLSERK